MVPLLVPNCRPLGSVSLIAHEVIKPGPANCGANGKSELAVLFDNSRSLGL